MTKRGNVVKDSFQYFSSQIIQQAVSILRGMILPNILSPFHYGIIATLNLVERYSTFTNLGIHTANLYHIPAKRTTGDFKEVESIKNNVYSFSILMGSLAVVLILILSGIFLHTGKISKEIFWGLLIVSATPLLIMVRGNYMTLLRANKEFSLLSTTTLIMSVVGAVLMIVLALVFKAYGVLAGEMLAIVSVLLFIRRRAHFQFKFELSPKKIAELLRFSIPIFFLVGFLHVFMITMDRLMIVKHLGVKEVGYYAIGLTLSNLLLLFPTATATVLSTRVIEECSRPKGDAESLMCQTTYLLALFTSFLAALLCLACPSIFQIIFPKYKPGIPSAMILPFAFYFEAIGILPYYALVVKGKIKSYILTMGLITGASYLLFIYVIKSKSLLEIAFLIIAIYFLKCMNTLLFASFATIKKRKNIMIFLSLPLLFIAGAALASLFLNHIFPDPPNALKGIFVELFFLKAVMLVLLYLPIFFYFNKRTGLIKKTYVRCMEMIQTGEFLKRRVPQTVIQE